MPLGVGHGAVCGPRMALNKSTFGERDYLVAGDDEMVDQPHIHQAQRVLQVLCQQLIGPRGLGFPGGMVVGNGQRGGVTGERSFDQFPRIDGGLGQCPPEQFLCFDQAMLGVQVERQEHLMLEPSACLLYTSDAADE